MTVRWTSWDRVAAFGGRAWHWIATSASVPPDDPLGPVSQDSQQIREAACKLTAADRDCVPSTISTLPRGASGGAGGNIVSTILLVLFVALVLGLLVLAARSILLRDKSRRRRRSSTSADDDGGDNDDVVSIGHTVVDHRRTPADWRAEADEHRRAGRHREALRCRYRALVGDLARRNVIDEIPGRTTGEERRQLAAVAPAQQTSFDSAADLFDGAWYGDADVDDGDVATMIALEDEVLRRAGRT